MADLSFNGIKQALSSLLFQSKGEDAVSMLTEDHKRVKEIFDTFKDMSEDEKMDAVHKALVELALHAACEEKLVYPLLREEGENEEDEVDEALEEHHVVKLLIRELAGMNSASARLDAKFKVLGEIVQHHVEEEEHKMFPELRSADDIDLHAVGEKIALMKEELLAKLGDGQDLGLIDPELSYHVNGNGNSHQNGSNGNGKAKAPGRKTAPSRSAAAKRASKVKGKSAAKKDTKKSGAKPAAKSTKAAKAAKPAAKKAGAKPVAKKKAAAPTGKGNTRLKVKAASKATKPARAKAAAAKPKASAKPKATAKSAAGKSKKVAKKSARSK